MDMRFLCMLTAVAVSALAREILESRVLGQSQ